MFRNIVDKRKNSWFYSSLNQCAFSVWDVSNLHLEKCSTSESEWGDLKGFVQSSPNIVLSILTWKKITKSSIACNIFYKELSENMIYNYHSIVCKTLGNRPANRDLSFKRGGWFCSFQIVNYVYQLVTF